MLQTAQHSTFPLDSGTVQIVMLSLVHIPLSLRMDHIQNNELKMSMTSSKSIIYLGSKKMNSRTDSEREKEVKKVRREK